MVGSQKRLCLRRRGLGIEGFRGRCSGGPSGLPLSPGFYRGIRIIGALAYLGPLRLRRAGVSIYRTDRDSVVRGRAVEAQVALPTALVLCVVDVFARV